jgi:hypothetical protein
MATSFKSGKLAVFTIDGTSLSTIGWTIGGQIQKVQFKNSDTGTIPRNEATFHAKTVTLNFDYNFNASPFASPISVYDGAILENVLCYLDGVTGTPWNFTSLFVDSVNQSVTTEGKPVQSIQCSLNGPYTPPGGTLQGTTGN